MRIAERLFSQQISRGTYLNESGGYFEGPGHPKPPKNRMCRGTKLPLELSYHWILVAIGLVAIGTFAAIGTYLPLTGTLVVIET